MQDRDNLEEFIASEVNQIEFDDADAMWQAFQVRLKKEKAGSINRFWYWAGSFSLLLLIAFGIYFWGGALSQTRVANENKEEGATIEKEFNSSSPSYLEPGQAQVSNKQLRTNDYDSSIQHGQIIEPGVQNEAPIHSAHPNSIGRTPKGINIGSQQASRAEEISDIVQNENDQEGATLGIIDSSQVHKAFAQEYLAQPEAEETIAQEGAAVMAKSWAPIAKIETKRLQPLYSDENQSLGNIKCEWITSKPKRLFLSIENSFAYNGIRQHAIGFGKYFPLQKVPFSLKVQAGGSLDVGYSFSQDSFFIFNGLSIRETRKDKDLRNLWNAYLDVGLYHRKNNWQFGLGFRGGYALFNQFDFVETTRLTTLNGSSGETKENVGKGNWSGMSRMSLEVYLNINYQMNANFSVGLFAGKRQNELIKNDMASRAYSNTPVKFGVVANKYF